MRRRIPGRPSNLRGPSWRMADAVPQCLGGPGAGRVFLRSSSLVSRTSPCARPPNPVPPEGPRYLPERLRRQARFAPAIQGVVVRRARGAPARRHNPGRHSGTSRYWTSSRRFSSPCRSQSGLSTSMTRRGTLFRPRSPEAIAGRSPPSRELSPIRMWKRHGTWRRSTRRSPAPPTWPSSSSGRCAPSTRFDFPGCSPGTPRRASALVPAVAAPSGPESAQIDDHKVEALLGFARGVIERDKEWNPWLLAGCSRAPGAPPRPCGRRGGDTRRRALPEQRFSPSARGALAVERLLTALAQAWPGPRNAAARA